MSERIEIRCLFCEKLLYSKESRDKRLCVRCENIVTEMIDKIASEKNKIPDTMVIKYE